MKNLLKQSKALVLGSLVVIPLMVAGGCSSSSSGPDAGMGGGAGVGGSAPGNGGAAGGSNGGMGGALSGGGGAAGSSGDAGGMMGTAGAGGQAGAIELTDFVNDLIMNRTASNTLPETLDDKTFTDSMNPAAFSSFFP